MYFWTCLIIDKIYLRKKRLRRTVKMIERMMEVTMGAKKVKLPF